MRPIIIKGGYHKDDRGTISFVNDFDMASVRRFYKINHPNTSIIRAWQGHKTESKYFYIVNGSFQIVVIEPDNWDKPSNNLITRSFILNQEHSDILFVPYGYYNGFKALKENSSMIVFSDKTLDESKNDDFRLPVDYWEIDWKIK